MLGSIYNFYYILFLIKYVFIFFCYRDSMILGVGEKYVNYYIENFFNLD